MRNHKVPPCPMTQRAVSPTLGLSGPHFQLVGSLWQPPMSSTIEEPAPNSFKLLQTANGVIFTPLRWISLLVTALPFPTLHFSELEMAEI